MEKLAYYILGMVVVLIVGGSIVGSMPEKIIKSDRELIPDIEIRIFNGVSDTTYIYRLK